MDFEYMAEITAEKIAEMLSDAGRETFSVNPSASEYPTVDIVRDIGNGRHSVFLVFSGSTWTDVYLSTFSALHTLCSYQGLIDDKKQA